MLPAIATHARISFRYLDPEARQEAVAECVANAFVAYTRLYALGKVELAYASPLARFGISQVKGGRKVGGHLNIRDVSSVYCQRQKGVVLKRLDHSTRKRTPGRKRWSLTPALRRCPTL